MQSVYLVFSVFTKDEDITGQFIGKTETVEWRKAHLMLAGKWAVDEEPSQ